MTPLAHQDLLLIACCILTEAGRELCFKRGADGQALAQSLRSGFVWAGIGLWAAELLLWVRVLEHVPLTLAFPLMSIVYVVIFLGGLWLLHEPLTRRHALGAVLVTAGVALIGSSGL